MFRPRFSRRDRLDVEQVRPRHHSLPHEYDDETSDALLSERDDGQHSRRKSEPDPGPLGLNVVHLPEDGAYKADIVFIHGLGGTSRYTWSKNKNPSLFWPLHFLPLEPDVAQTRILTFGYDANFWRRGSVSVSIFDLAKDLLFDLKYAKDKEGEDLNIGSVPLLFVVHSMGGLIIKEAYIQGQNDPEYESIVKAVASIMFLATPHRGTNLAALLNLILTSTLFSNPKEYVNDLKHGSSALQKLNDQFRHIAPKLNIVSFYETQPTPIGLKNAAVMILEKETSILGYPGEVSKALHADHHNVCKYENVQDPNYIVVRNVLKSLVAKLFAKARSPSKSRPPNRQQSRDLKTLLGITALPDADYIFFRDQWTEGTGQWILEDKTYLKWFDPADSVRDSRVLWLSGGPGTGKSVLSSLVINEIVQQGHCCQYIFLRANDQKKRGLSSLLRTFAYQLTRSVPAFLEKVLDVVDEGLDLSTADARLIWERLFVSGVLRGRDMPEVLYWIIDGVDEAADPRAVIKVLSDVRLLAANIRLMFVSRMTSDILAAFNRVPAALSPTSMRLEARLDDLQCYINQELAIHASPEIEADVVQRLVAGSQNNFLWLRLAVEKINSCHTEEDIDAAFHELPEGMEALYDRMALSIAQYQSVQDKALATAILQCVTTSLRLLSVSELSHAIQEDTSRILDVQRSIIDLCGGFAVIDNGGNVAMVHQTARQYLLERDVGKPFFIDKEAAHSHMFMSCMRSFMVVGLKAKIQSHQKPEFLDYAATSWSKHLAAAERGWRPALDTLSKFLSGPWVLMWIHYLSSTAQLGVLVEAARDLSLYFNRQRKSYAKLGVQDSAQYSRQALLEGWPTDFVKLVGKFGMILRCNPEAIYKLIPPFCPRSSSIYQIFGKAEATNLSVSGFSSEKWDDSIARLTAGPGSFATSIAVTGSQIAILTTKGNSMRTLLYHPSTFDALPASPIVHGERIQKIELNKTGTLLAAYGFRTTSIWNTSSGECLLSTPNAKPGQKALAMLMMNHDSQLLVGTDDRCLRYLDLTDESAHWHVLAELDEEEIEGHHLNSASFMVLNRDGTLVAVAYRGHPMSAWEVEGPGMLGHCLRTREEVTFGQIFEAVWSPQYPELFGLYTEGTLFRWRPYDDETIELPMGASKLCISTDGNLIGAGDARGGVRVLNASDLSILYQITAEESVFGLAFSPDARRIYDLRGFYANAWEPNVLLKLAEQQESGVDSQSDTESFVTGSTLPVAPNSGRISSVTTLAASPTGRFCSYGTDQGDIYLYDLRTESLNHIFSAKSFFSIEHLEWADDGQYLACSYAGKRVVIISVQPHDMRDGGLQKSAFAELKADVQIKMESSNVLVSQLLFDRTSTRLAVISTSSIRVICTKTFAVSRSVVLQSASQCKWILHPNDNTNMLRIMSEAMQVIDWNLEEQSKYAFEQPPPLYGQPQANVQRDLDNTIESQTKISNTSTHETTGDTVDQVIVTQGRKGKVLVQMTLGQLKSRRKVFLSFETSWLHSEKLSSPAPADRENHREPNEPPVLTNAMLQPSHFFPLGIAEDVSLVLGSVPGEKVLFLSRNFAICSWRIPSATTPTFKVEHDDLQSASTQTRPASTLTLRPGVARHLSLPSDSSQAQLQPSGKRPMTLTRNSLSDIMNRNATTAIHGRPSASATSQNQASRLAPFAKAIFYLPADWINRDWFAPCVLWAKEKSLLCPRNGEVAVVRCGSLV